jgi:hypothetical protein
MRGRPGGGGRAGALIAVVAAGVAGCRTGAPAIEFEASDLPYDLVCDRVRDVLASKDEGYIRVELPAVAEMVATAQSTSGPVSDCGDQLLAWNRAALAARPIDLRPRLEARILALGPLIGVGMNYKWTDAATDVLGGLLLDAGKPTVHLLEERTFLGPGSQRVRTGYREIVSLDQLDRWAAAALRRGYGDKVFMTGSLGSSVHDKYRDLLARLFAARYAEPARSRWESPALHAFPFVGTPVRSPPPPPEKLGCGSSALDALWPDLVRAFRAAPKHALWDTLPAPIADRLRGPEGAPPCD